MRLHLFEFEDLRWFPEIIRQGMLDYLRFIFEKLDLYAPAAPLIAEALKISNHNRIIDLCSGAGGPVLNLHKKTEEITRQNISVTLCDKFPNLPAYINLKEISDGKIDYCTQPVDAADVPENLHGLRTMFSAFHHFKMNDAKKVLRNAVDNNMPIAVFDGGDKNIFFILLSLIFHLLMFIIFTPFIKPFRLSRFIFTYLIPLIPICTIWDGIISVLRLYSLKDLDKMVNEAQCTNYTWRSGKIRHPSGVHIIYLMGYP